MAQFHNRIEAFDPSDFRQEACMLTREDITALRAAHAIVARVSQASPRIGSAYLGELTIHREQSGPRRDTRELACLVYAGVYGAHSWDSFCDTLASYVNSRADYLTFARSLKVGDVLLAQLVGGNDSPLLANKGLTHDQYAIGIARKARSAAHYGEVARYNLDSPIYEYGSPVRGFAGVRKSAAA